MNPPMNIWKGAELYQLVAGISLLMFFVRQGASKAGAQFFPNTPPTTVKGAPTTKGSSICTTIKVK